MERLETLLTKSILFYYFRPPEKNLHRQLQSAVYKIAIDFLLSGLSEEEKAVLLYKHWHQPDPNDSNTGRTLSFLERLIEDSCFQSLINGRMVATLYIEDIDCYTGLKDIKKLSSLIKSINTKWEKVATISCSEEEQIIHFEITAIVKEN